MMVAIPTARVFVLVALFAAVACAADDGDDGSMGPTTAADDGSSGAPMTSTAGADESTSDGAETTEGGDASSSSGAPAIDYATQIQPIWDAACTCHLQGPSGTMTATTLTLNADVSYEELVDTASTQSDLPRIAPGDLEGSYLWHKLDGTQAEVGGMGTNMPQIGELTDEELALIEAWITAGAPS